MRRTFAAVAAVAVLGAGAIAYVRAADEPAGYVGQGQLVVRTSLGGGGNTLTIGGNVAMEERGSRLRVDVLSLAIPGTDPTISALIGTQLFPPGGFTIVYDRATASYTVWSNAKQRYFTNAPANALRAPQPPVAASIAGGGDLFGPFAFAKSLKDDSAFNASFGLAGHSTVNGHPATGLNFSYQRTTNSGNALDVHGTFQFADDLDGVPVEITIDGKGKSFPESAFRLDFTSLTKRTPDDADFVPPPGFTRASSIGDVIGKALPIPGA